MPLSKKGSMNERGGVAIAIDKDKNSQSALKWAAENLLKKNRYCVLLHVRCQSMGPDDAEFVPKGGRPPTEAELKQFFLPFRGFCARKGIAATEVILHDIDVPSAVVDYVAANSIVNLVVGASARNMFMRQSNGLLMNRKIKSADVATALLKMAPEYCSVYVIMKERIHAVRHGKQQSLAAMQTSMADAGPDAPSTNTKYSPAVWSHPAKLQTISQDTYNSRSSSSMSSDSNFSLKSSDSRGTERSDTTNSFTKRVVSPAKTLESYISENSSTSSASDITDFSMNFSYQSSDVNNNSGSGHSYPSDNSMASSSGAASQRKMDEEMARLQLEFQQSLSDYNMACKDMANAEKRMHSVEIRDFEEHEAPKEVWSPEKRVARPQPQLLRRLSKLGDQKEPTSPKLGGVSLRTYSINDIEMATDYFSDSRKIGEGGYGPVYKAVLDETHVAIKVLRPDVSQGLRQFQQELNVELSMSCPVRLMMCVPWYKVEVLSGMRHPNMVHLVGACPEYGCLVYEYMDYGSLEDRLFRKDDTPPIPWRTRFEIAAEIAMGLFFLHQTKPEPLVHRDIKPSNILLDKNYRSKIGDVGLARLVPASVANRVTQYHMTAAAGTFCYIDPEYQQTGMLGCKSDVYSFGVVLLQILTSKPPIGLALRVEDSIEEGTFHEVLDPAIKDWPVEEAKSLAKLALKCCELRRRDRPDLASVVLPALIRAKNLGLDGYTGNNKVVFDPVPKVSR